MLKAIIGGDRLIGATYARVSTKKQVDGISLDQQDAQMLHYATTNGIEIPQAYRFREQVSGFSDVREYYDQIRVLVREQHIQALIVYTSDRYTRDPVHGDLFREELRRNGVTLHVVSEGGQVDITSPMGQFMRRQMDNFNWYWGQMIKKNVMEKRQSYTEAGVPYVGGFACYGYTRTGRRRDAKLVFVEDERQIVINIYTWYNAGHSVALIIEMLRGTPAPGDLVYNPKRKRGFGEWSPSTIYKILSDPTYRGVYYANRSKMIESVTGGRVKTRNDKKEYFPINVPAIIDDELWFAVQRRLEDNAKGGGRSIRSEYEMLITGRSKCRHCGGSVSGNKTSTGKIYYRCNRRYMKTYVEQGCDFLPVRVDEVDPLIWDKVRELVEHPNALRAVLESSREQQSGQVAKIERQLEELDALMADKKKASAGIANALAAEYSQARPNELTIAALRQQADDLQRAVEQIQERRLPLLAQLDEKVVSQRYIEDVVAYAESIHDQIPVAGFELQREIIDRLNFRFEFEIHDETTAMVYLQWHIYEIDIVVPRPRRGNRRQEDLSGARRLSEAEEGDQGYRNESTRA